MSEQIEELDRLAQKFIIGHVPLTDEQREILLNIRELETRLHAMDVQRKRIERILTVLYNRL